MSTHDEAYHAARSAIERLTIASDEDSDLSVEARLGHVSSAARWVRKAQKAFEDLVDSHSAAVANVAPGQTHIDDIPGVADQRGSTVTVDGSHMVLTPADIGMEPAAPTGSDGDAVLDALTRRQHPCTVAQLAADVDRRGAEVLRILLDLEGRSLVHQDPPNIWHAGAAESAQEAPESTRAAEDAEPVAATVRQTLEGAPGVSMTTTEIVAVTGLTHAAVDEVCRTFAQLDRVEKLGRGRWRWKVETVEAVGVSAREPAGAPS